MKCGLFNSFREPLRWSVAPFSSSVVSRTEVHVNGCTTDGQLGLFGADSDIH